MIANTVYAFLIIGIGGTLVLDIYAWAMAKFFNLPATNWLLVGRWIGHMKSGVFVQPTLASAPKIRGELIIGWLTHYVIGITYGLILMLCVNAQWLQAPSVLATLVVAWVGILAPYFIMMPGMGFGVAGSKTPNPTATRVKSLVGHTIFGLGMFLTAWIIGPATSQLQ